MVILVKLNNSTETSGRFSNRFNVPITIQPNSQIALLNASINVTTENIVITNSNNTFVLEVSANVPRNVVLTNGTYDWYGFRNELQRALNASLIYQGLSDSNYMSGFQLKCYKKENKLFIAFDRVNTNGYSLDTLSTISNVTYDDATTNWKKDAGTQDTWDGYVESNRYFTGGCGVLTMKTVCPTANMGTPEYANYRFLCGLRSIEGALVQAGERQPVDCDYAIYCGLNTGSTANVFYVRYPDDDGNPIIVETTNSVVTLYQASIILTEGKLQLEIKNQANTVIHLTEIKLDADFYMQHMYAVVGLTRTSSQLRNALFHSDPYHKQSVSASDPEHYYNDSIKPYNGVDNNTQLGAITATQVKIMMNTGVLSLLGFQANPPVQKTIRGGFHADNHIREVYLPNNLKIELDNIDLQTYDSYTNDKRNILATIPKIQYTESDTGSIAYSTDYPVWMDMRNIRPFTLNTIAVSIMNYENQYQQLVDHECDLTLLIRDNNNLN